MPVRRSIVAPSSQGQKFLLFHGVFGTFWLTLLPAENPRSTPEVIFVLNIRSLSGDVREIGAINTGRISHKGCANILFGKLFAENSMKMKEIRPGKKGRHRGAPSASPWEPPISLWTWLLYSKLCSNTSRPWVFPLRAMQCIRDVTQIIGLHNCQTETMITKFNSVLLKLGAMILTQSTIGVTTVQVANQ